MLAIGGNEIHQTSRILAATEGAIARGGAEIVNWSLGYTKCSAVSFPLRLLRRCYEDARVDAVAQDWQEFIQEHGDVLFVTSAGNEDVDAQFALPANIDEANLISVGATDREDGRARFGLGILGASNFGTSVDLAAPGIDVYAPRPGGTYDKNFSGTSAAAPFVTGVAAILKALDPEVAPQELASRLTSVFQR